ncbi:hypothetical protein DV702_16135 [Sporosarcina sp. PTS2304]|uniref:hypothetical protein n=1 Tax=Sporosarcina sp. PTS2304 TaxID=2283194 RepID=UPI000E0CDA54|nr:hypothetical protein [Sporosarcina sp. PTS2304]AXI01112.1 hypothetical protein DV702_16135 [Sporosarcina sp. PTS2304]
MCPSFDAYIASTESLIEPARPLIASTESLIEPAHPLIASTESLIENTAIHTVEYKILPHISG